MLSFNNHSIFLLFVNRFCYDVGKVISKNYNLTVNERNTLIVLTNLEINSVKDLSQYISLSKTNTSKVLSSLEKKNLIVRILDKTDKRHNQLFLTEDGKILADRVIEEINKLFEKRIAQFPAQLGEKIHKLVDEYTKQIRLNQTSKIN
jgi:DNA-binding MarR family transcriptional regulator